MGYLNYEYCGYCRYCICDNARMDIMNGKFKCDREREWVFADARPLKGNCFWQVPSYNLSDRDAAISASRAYRNFYITTMIFHKLEINDTQALDTLYAFRHGFMEENNGEFLEDYDTFGPRIAKILSLIDKDNSRCESLFKFYLEGTLKSIYEGNLVDASELYVSMYNRLKSEFIYAPLKEKYVYPYSVKSL